MFIRLASSSGSSGGVLASGVGALDAVFNPGAARAREELDRQHELVMPSPSPGDRLLDEGRVVIDLTGSEIL